MNRGAPSRSAAFTLLEMLAVVLILAIMALLVLPGLGILGGRELKQALGSMSADLELARQRSVMTGVPHRLWLDLDTRRYHIEWEVTEARARGLEEEEKRGLAAVDADEELIDLSPPSAEKVAFYPLSTATGRATALPSGVRFKRVDVGSERQKRGEVAIHFGRDGTAERTFIWLADEEGRERGLEVLPLSEAVRVVDAS